MGRIALALLPALILFAGPAQATAGTVGDTFHCVITAGYLNSEDLNANMNYPGWDGYGTGPCVATHDGSLEPSGSALVSGGPTYGELSISGTGPLAVDCTHEGVILNGTAYLQSSLWGVSGAAVLTINRASVSMALSNAADTWGESGGAGTAVFPATYADGPWAGYNLGPWCTTGSEWQGFFSGPVTITVPDA